MTRIIINISALKQITKKVVKEYEDNILDKYHNCGDDGVFTLSILDDIIDSITKNETYINYGFSYYGGEGSTMELLIAIVKDVIVNIKKDNVVSFNEKTYYDDDCDMTEEQWAKRVKSVCPMFQDYEDEGVSYSIPSWYDKYTITPCFKSDIDKQIVLKALDLLAKTIEEVIDKTHY